MLSDRTKQVQFRMPDELHAELKAALAYDRSTVPIAVRSCTTELPTMASVRELSSIVRFIGSTRTSAEHTSFVSPYWNEWC